MKNADLVSYISLAFYLLTIVNCSHLSICLLISLFVMLYRLCLIAEDSIGLPHNSNHFIDTNYRHYNWKLKK